MLLNEFKNVGDYEVHICKKKAIAGMRRYKFEYEYIAIYQKLEGQSNLSCILIYSGGCDEMNDIVVGSVRSNLTHYNPDGQLIVDYAINPTPSRIKSYANFCSKALDEELNIACYASNDIFYPNERSPFYNAHSTIKQYLDLEDDCGLNIISNFRLGNYIKKLRKSNLTILGPSIKLMYEHKPKDFLYLSQIPYSESILLFEPNDGRKILFLSDANTKTIREVLKSSYKYFPGAMQNCLVVLPYIDKKDYFDVGLYKKLKPSCVICKNKIANDCFKEYLPKIPRFCLSSYYYDTLDKSSIIINNEHKWFFNGDGDFFPIEEDDVDDVVEDVEDVDDDDIPF